MEVVIEILPLGDITVAFEAICIRDWTCERSRLGEMLAVKCRQIPGTQRQSSDSPKWTTSRMAVDTARLFSEVEARQVSRRRGAFSLKIGCLGLGMAGGAESIFILEPGGCKAS